MSTTFEFGTRDVFDIEDITLGSDFADPFMSLFDDLGKEAFEPVRVGKLARQGSLDEGTISGNSPRSSIDTTAFNADLSVDPETSSYATQAPLKEERRVTRGALRKRRRSLDTIEASLTPLKEPKRASDEVCGDEKFFFPSFATEIVRHEDAFARAAACPIEMLSIHSAQCAPAPTHGFSMCDRLNLGMHCTYLGLTPDVTAQAVGEVLMHARSRRPAQPKLKLDLDGVTRLASGLLG